MKLSVLENGRVESGKEWRYRGINSPFNRLYFCRSGDGAITNGSQTCRLMPGRIYLVPLNVTYDYMCTSLELFYIHFTLDLLPGKDLFDEKNECMSETFSQKNIEEIYNAFTSRRLDSVLYCKSIITRALSRFARHITLKNQYNNPDKKIISILEFVQDNLTAQLRVADLVKQVGCSESSLVRIFKNITNQTPKSFINNQILTRAKKHLVLSNMTVKEIAYELGFHDEFYFSRFFKKMTGTPPSKYRDDQISLLYRDQVTAV
jgi:AraC-like DNA-binding protein